MRPANVRFYVDADTLGLAKILASIRDDVTYPGDPGGAVHGRERPACPITSTEVVDNVWIPQVAQREWTVITRDRHIERRPAERDAVMAYGAKIVVLTSRENLTIWHQLEIVMSRWRDIEQFHGQRGPFMYAITRTGFRRLL